MFRLDQKGSALLISLFCISLLMYMAAAFLSMSVNNYKMEKFNADSVKVMWVAEAGIAQMLHDIRDSYFDWCELSDEEDYEEKHRSINNELFPNFENKPRVKIETVEANTKEGVLNIRESTLTSRAEMKGRKHTVQVKVSANAAATDYILFLNKERLATEPTEYMQIYGSRVYNGAVHINGDAVLFVCGYSSTGGTLTINSYADTAGPTLEASGTITTETDYRGYHDDISWYYNGAIYLGREGGASYAISRPAWDSGQVIETLNPADFGGEVRDGNTGASYIKCPITPEEIKEEYRHLIDENWHITENNYNKGEYWQDIYWYVDETGQGHIAYEHITDPNDPLANCYFMDPERYSYTSSEITIPDYKASDYGALTIPSPPPALWWTDLSPYLRPSDIDYKNEVNAVLQPHLGDFIFFKEDCTGLGFGYSRKDLGDIANRVISGHSGYRLRQRDIDQIADFNIRNNLDLGSNAEGTPPNGVPDEEESNDYDRTTITLADADTVNYYWEKMVEIDLTKIPVDRYPENEIIFSEVPLWITGTPKKRITIVGLDTIIVSNINKYWEGNPSSGVIYKPSEDAPDSEKIRVAEELANDSRVKPVGIIGAERIYFDLVTPVESPWVMSPSYGLSKDGEQGIMRYLTYPRWLDAIPGWPGTKYVKGWPYGGDATSTAQWNRWVMTYDEGGEAGIDAHPEYWTSPTNWENYVVIQKVALVATKYQMSYYGGGVGWLGSNTSKRLKSVRFLGSRMIGTEPGRESTTRPAWWSEWGAVGQAQPYAEEHYYAQSFRRGDNPQTAIKEGPPPHMPVDITLLGWKSIRAEE